MSPDQKFARWVKVALTAFALLFIYFLIADSFMPMTPEARVMRPVARVAPELSAPVKEVTVRDHQQGAMVISGVWKQAEGVAYPVG